MSVHVDEVATRIVPGGQPPVAEPPTTTSPLHADQELWARQHRLAVRNHSRTEARGFDD